MFQNLCLTKLKNRVYLLNTLYLFHIFIYAFFPQQFLYFFPLPHELCTPILSVLFVFIILPVFQAFPDYVTSILFVLSVLFIL